MKIIFLCGTLEPGRDGVGDYTRRLAGELIRQNHQVAIIALHDKYVNKHFLENVQFDENQKIETLRLSNHMSWEDRVLKSSVFIKIHDPEWLSLQYVPFSFHKKGLPIGFSKVLKRLIAGKKLHIMFHELWVGIEISASMKFKWWGYLQEMLIKEMLDKCKADVIHTHSKLYKYMLLTLGSQVKILPLFGNIPIKIELKESVKINEDKIINFVIFGGIHENSLVNEFIEELSEYAYTNEVRFKFIFLGRNGPKSKHWINLFIKAGFLVEVLGEQSVVTISKILSACSFAITSTPFPLIEKSGSIAAMLEHNLNVICIRKEWKSRYNFNCSNDEIQLFKIGNFDSIYKNKRVEMEYKNSLQQITSTFIKNLSL